jgi:hypothetical protein
VDDVLASQRRGRAGDHGDHQDQEDRAEYAVLGQGGPPSDRKPGPSSDYGRATVPPSRPKGKAGRSANSLKKGEMLRLCALQGGRCTPYIPASLAVL